MELTSFWDSIFSPVAQAKFVHTLSPPGMSPVQCSNFAISGHYLLSGTSPGIRQLFIIAASAFGLAARSVWWCWVKRKSGSHRVRRSED